MSAPFVGEIRIFGFNRVPSGWLACDGSTPPIASYEVLYSLIGTTYGGDGQSTFGLPDLRGRAPLHQGTGGGLSPRLMGEVGGAEEVQLLTSQMGAHSHTMLASTASGMTAAPDQSSDVATITAENLYIPDVTSMTPVALAPRSVGLAGGSTPHDNMMPTLTVSYCIAWAGVFPNRQ